MLDDILTTPLVLLINGALLVLSIALAIIMLQAGVMWGMNSGNVPEQMKYRRVLLIALVLLIFIGLAASVMNLFLA